MDLTYPQYPATQGFAPASSAGGDMDIMQIMETLKTDREKEAEIAKRLAEAGKPNVGGRLGGLAAIIALSLLGGKAGRAGMGEAMGAYNQNFTASDQEARAMRQAPIAAQLKGFQDQRKDSKDVMLAWMKPAFEAKARSMYRSPEHMTPDEREYERVKKAGEFSGTFPAWKDRNEGKTREAAEPAELRLFKALHGGKAPRTPEEFTEWHKSMRNDPDFIAAASAAMEEPASTKWTPEQLTMEIRKRHAAVKAARGGQPLAAPAGIPVFK